MSCRQGVSRSRECRSSHLLSGARSQRLASRERRGRTAAKSVPSSAAAPCAACRRCLRPLHTPSDHRSAPAPRRHRYTCGRRSRSCTVRWSVRRPGSWSTSSCQSTLDSFWLPTAGRDRCCRVADALSRPASGYVFVDAGSRATERAGLTYSPPRSHPPPPNYASCWRPAGATRPGKTRTCAHRSPTPSFAAARSRGDRILCRVLGSSARPKRTAWGRVTSVVIHRSLSWTKS